jgi:hypothetical protein
MSGRPSELLIPAATQHVHRGAQNGIGSQPASAMQGTRRARFAAALIGRAAELGKPQGDGHAVQGGGMQCPCKRPAAGTTARKVSQTKLRTGFVRAWWLAGRHQKRPASSIDVSVGPTGHAPAHRRKSQRRNGGFAAERNSSRKSIGTPLTGPCGAGLGRRAPFDVGEQKSERFPKTCPR